MNFDDILEQAIEMLQRRGRLTYRTLKRQFHLDDETLEDLTFELIEGQRLATDENGTVLVWIGETDGTPALVTQPDQPTQQLTAQEEPSPQVESPPTEPHTPDAERRQLTVMFCDLVDSTKLSSQLDPEDYREVVRAYQATCTEVIHRFDGYIAQYLGDGLLVYFGYPQAHEDDAQRAVRTGLGIVEAISSLNTRLEQDKSIKLALRLGIHTGLVVVGEMGGEGRQERLALGETPNLVARIQGIVQPDTVAISADTYRLIQGYFDCEPLGEHDLRGVAQPIAVYRVLGDSGIHTRLDVVAARGLTPLVGRESEVTLLLERWAQVKDGHGQVMLLSGEAGIGKSRLVQVLKDHAKDEPHAQIECRCSPYHTNSAFYPLAELLQRKLGWQPEDTADAKLHKLETVLAQIHLDVNTAVPLFTALLSLPLPDDRYPPIQLSSQQQRQQTLEAFLQLVLLASEQHPVLFIVEDLHWVDPSTLEFLQLLIDQAPTTSLYLLVTCRPDYQPSWSHKSYLTEITVNRLSRHQIEQMVTQVVSRKTLPVEIIEQLVDKTDGVPLYVEEMTKAVLESGTLKEVNGQYELVGSVSSLVIPATLQDSLMARLDRLVTAKAVAQYASVIGRQFSYELLQAVSQLDETMLQHELGRLVAAELVYQRGLPPHAIYMFKHALIQDTAYASLLRSTRQGYHRHIAEVLVERFPETAEAQPELLAHHYTEAGLNGQAVDYWYKAGQKAIERSAHVEVIRHLQRGLVLLTMLPESSERARRELHMRTTLGRILMLTKGHGAPEVEHTLVRARALCQQIGDYNELLPVLNGLWIVTLVRAELHQARALAEESLRLVQDRPDPVLLSRAHDVLGETSFYLGEFTATRDHMEQCLALYDPQQHQRSDLRYEGPSRGVTGLVFLAKALWILGYPEQALTKTDEACDLAYQLAHPVSLALALDFAAGLHLLRREVQAMQARSYELLELAQTQALPFWVAWAKTLQGWRQAVQDKRQIELDQMQEGLAECRATGSELDRPWLLGLIAEVCGQGRQSEEGLTVLAEALALADTTGERWYEAELHRLKGQLLLQQSPDNATKAETCFQQAVTIAQNQQAKSWELRATTSLARLRQSQGKRDEARELLEPVYSWFTEGFDTADLIDVKTLLDELA
jgi:predicted ATPase/class 3 adenylate cyclase